MFESPTLNLNLRRSGVSRARPWPKAKISSELPLYSPITTDHLDTTTSLTTSTSGLNFSDNEQDGELSPTDPLKPAQRHASPSCSSSSSTWQPRPSLSRFLADFTLGFADGLTVPFALTAGLSSLGQTDTVIYAGMAEICAGSISMGIGGYLSAKGEAGEVQSTPTVASAVEVDEKIRSAAVVAKYLAPLDLPPDLRDLVRQHVLVRSDVHSTISRKLAAEEERDEDDDEGNIPPPSSIMVGLSVAAGYLIGGILPLFPYFVVSHVGDGLMWSFVVCIIALFLFGFVKAFVLHREQDNGEVWVKDTGSSMEQNGSMTIDWKNVKRSAWEGLLMVMLGSMAALAAVVCVRLFEGMAAHAKPQP